MVPIFVVQWQLLNVYLCSVHCPSRRDAHGPRGNHQRRRLSCFMFVGSFLLEASLTVKNQSLGPMQFLPTQHLCLPPSPRRVPFTILFATLISHVSNPPVNMWPNAKPDTVNFFSGVAPSCICTLVWRLRQWGTWVGGQGIQGLCLWKQFFCPHCSGIGKGQGDSIFECFWWSCRLYQMTRRSITALSEIGRSHAVMENS